MVLSPYMVLAKDREASGEKVGKGDATKKPLPVLGSRSRGWRRAIGFDQNRNG